MVKELTAKQRSEIYLKAAHKEFNKYFPWENTVWDFLGKSAGLERYEKYKIFSVFPELEMFESKRMTLTNYEWQDIRILALLFAREIALQP